MSNALYDKGRKAFADGEIDLLDNDIRAILVDLDDYTLDLVNDKALDDIPVGARVAVSGALSGKSTDAGVFDAADKTLPTVTGDRFEYIVLYLHTGLESTSLLICCIDTATGLPCTPNGGDIILQWDTGVSKIFKL